MRLRPGCVGTVLTVGEAWFMILQDLRDTWRSVRRAKTVSTLSAVQLGVAAFYRARRRSKNRAISLNASRVAGALLSHM